MMNDDTINFHLLHISKNNRFDGHCHDLTVEISLLRLSGLHVRADKILNRMEEAGKQRFVTNLSKRVIKFS